MKWPLNLAASAMATVYEKITRAKKSPSPPDENENVNERSTQEQSSLNSSSAEAVSSTTDATSSTADATSSTAVTTSSTAVATSSTAEESSSVASGSTEDILKPTFEDVPADSEATVVEPLPEKLALSFSGCGFLGCYHFGVVLCFQKNGQNLMKRVTRFAGASAGSLVAALTVLAPDKLETGLEQLYSMADEINAMTFGAMTPGFQLHERLSQIATKVLENDDISTAQDKLHISLTRNTDKKNRLLSKFKDKEELLQALLASCYIPMYSISYKATPPKIDNECYIDGGFSDNLPVFDDVYTITISPFSGSATISPHDQNAFDWRMTVANQQMKVNLHNIFRGARALFPPTSSVLHSYYEMGYRDGMKFLLKHNCLERNESSEV